MAKRFRRMTESDINLIIKDLNRWAMGDLGSKLTWGLLEERFGFSRQSLQAKPEIKAAYDTAKLALSGGIVKTKEQATQENTELLVEIARLKAELEAYKQKEQKWMLRWQQIAFHVRQKGIQMADISKTRPEKTAVPSNTDTTQILRPLDKEIPRSL
ncbi:MAG TPA: protein kinase [Gammaproteobacteria bacterium]|nr:protein kinase [Gammaproteobacteria bacterium]HBF08401.1 protein kinase [Gammaproteobacteria bacterium]HCK92238.1 protein kinase [Gammaproteobacteria bacterium]|tara:strand:+ start:119 stop:589 length:471 start_codon:yes stop_codon:yes gene_type:complete